MALSQDYADGSPIRGRPARHSAAEVVRRLLQQEWPANTLIDVNFPGVPTDGVAGFAVTRQGKRGIADNLTEARTRAARPITGWARFAGLATPTRHRHRRADREQGLDRRSTWT